MATIVLLRLAALTGEGRYRTAADGAIASVTAFASRYPTAFASWLTSMDLALAPVVEVAVVGDPAAADTRRLLEPVVGGYRPNQVLAVSNTPEASVVPLLDGRFAIDGRPTVFVCQGFSCRQPVTEPDAVRLLLAEARTPA